MKYCLSLLCSISVLSSHQLLRADTPAPKDVYSVKETSIDGKEVDFSEFKGKALLIVNVASQCGATSQYKGLQALNDYFKDKGLVVMGFPSNDFGAQEPGSNEEIKNFCSTKYQVTFPMFEKGPVKGEGKSELFEYLSTAENPDKTGEIGWNFEKFLIGKDGKLLRRFSTSVDPYDDEFVEAIEKALK